MIYNLKMKKSHVGWLFFIFVILYFTSDYWLPSKIDTIYKSEFESDQGSFVITIANPPLTKKDMLSFWSENKKYILDEVNGLDEGESILFVKNEFENKSKEEAVQFCLLEQKNDEEPCVSYSDRLFIAERENINRVKSYRLTFSDYYGASSCAIYERDDGEKEYNNDCTDVK
ncbi:hypothetical protein Tola_0075 [Tolumonas auensis DSM 9187]|uniref:Uncharacterized protein n=1 Tax=Tolumonas auensis (strain DSM 9187 / NBRC 110442 / TA 4) TaxID=595494 RepID=C4L7C9_TOLAT|nr:hypothetical protein Tola_0075 [Tolumonas auensis DSM 9187]